MGTLYTRILLLGIATLLANPSLSEARKKKTFLDQVQDAAVAKVNETLVKPPEDGEVCFSPEENCDIKLIKFIRSAQTSIEIAIFDINLARLVEEILEKAQKVRVRLVVDRRQAKGERSAVPTLVNAGIDVKFGKQKGVMHNKFAIVDGKRLMTGSFNMTNAGSKANNENQVYLADPKIVERFKARFEKLWAEGKPAGPD